MKLVIVLLIKLVIAQSVDASELDEQLRASKEQIKKEIKKIELILSKTNKKTLSTKIGDESMSELDVLEASVSHMNLSVEYMDFYLRHLNKPIKVDAVGQTYR